MDEQEEPEEELEDVVEITEDKVDALINLLVKKNIISEEELTKETDGLYEEDEATE